MRSAFALAAAALAAPSGGSTIGIVAYNAWNSVDGPDWEARVPQLAALALGTGAEVIVFEEVRQVDGGADMLADLQALLPGYEGWWRAVMSYGDSSEARRRPSPSAAYPPLTQSAGHCDFHAGGGARGPD